MRQGSDRNLRARSAISLKRRPFAAKMGAYPLGVNSRIIALAMTGSFAVIASEAKQYRAGRSCFCVGPAKFALFGTQDPALGWGLNPADAVRGYVKPHEKR